MISGKGVLSGSQVTKASLSRFAELAKKIGTIATQRTRERVSSARKRLMRVVREQKRIAKTCKLRPVALTLTYRNSEEFSSRHISNFVSCMRQFLKRRDCRMMYAWVLTNSEWDKILAALSGHRNFYVIPALCFLLHTAMRSSEQLMGARWEDVDWEHKVLKLRDAKAGGRRVPLGPEAIDTLKSLREAIRARSLKAGGLVDESAPAEAGPIFALSYEALKKAWSTACRTAGIENARLHDLRHTAATRYALAFNGNVFVLKAITGHKTDAMLSRYVNITPELVAKMMHQKTLGDDHAPAGTARVSAEAEELPENVVRLFRSQ